MHDWVLGLLPVLALPYAIPHNSLKKKKTIDQILYLIEVTTRKKGEKAAKGEVVDVELEEKERVWFD